MKLFSDYKVLQLRELESQDALRLTQAERNSLVGHGAARRLAAGLGEQRQQSGPTREPQAGVGYGPTERTPPPPSVPRTRGTRPSPSPTPCTSRNYNRRQPLSPICWWADPQHGGRTQGLRPGAGGDNGHSLKGRALHWPTLNLQSA